jgi:type II restriction enzyme
MESLVGESVEKPKGTLAGHAAGAPFEKLVHAKLVDEFGERSSRHFEFLNRVLQELNDDEVEARLEAFGPQSIQSLVCRGKGQMKSWSPSNQFEEKQNDTAESIIPETWPYVPTQSFLLLADVKTHSLEKDGQPPNIMSAGKLAEALALALEEGAVRFDFIYLGISWKAEADRLVCKSSDAISLFKMEPRPYINWAAAEQLQFQVNGASQKFTGTREEWAKQFLKHFADSLESRITKQTARLARFRSLSAS